MTHVLIEFASPEALVAAVKRLREENFEQLETYTPWLVEGIDEALALPKSPVPKLVLAAGLLGAVTAYVIQWWTNAVDYPLEVGGRPVHAAPAFFLITFETTVLFAGLTALFSVLALAGLPRLWHRVFEVDAFRSATIDGFWIEVSTTDDELPRLRHVVEPTGAKRLIETKAAP